MQYEFTRDTSLPYLGAWELHPELNKILPDIIIGVSTVGHKKPYVIYVDTARELTDDEKSKIRAVVEQ